jgi:hypothetical protein
LLGPKNVRTGERDLAEVEYSVEVPEVQPGVGERGRRPAPAVDHEGPPVHDHSRRGSAPARHRQRRASGPEQHKLCRHTRTPAVRLTRQGYSRAQTPVRFEQRATLAFAVAPTPWTSFLDTGGGFVGESFIRLGNDPVRDDELYVRPLAGCQWVAEFEVLILPFLSTKKLAVSVPAFATRCGPRARARPQFSPTFSSMC